MSNLCRVNILGVGISAITMAQALNQISNWIAQRSLHYVSLCTVHTVMEGQRDPAMRQALKGASLAAPDGMPLVWLGKWLSGGEVNRVYGPDLMLALCELSAEQGYSHYFYGGSTGVATSPCRIRRGGGLRGSASGTAANRAWV